MSVEPDAVFQQVDAEVYVLCQVVEAREAKQESESNQENQVDRLRQADAGILLVYKTESGAHEPLEFAQAVVTMER